ncbi:hypothetical protein MHH37_15860 [Solibacillus sp. FSL K6-1781]
MLRKVRDYLFEEEAEMGESDAAVLIIVAISLLFAGYALYQMGGF